MSEPSANGNSPGDDSRPLVFAVDDEPVLLELMALVLEPLGFRVRTFCDPDTAARVYGRTTPPPILIVTDYSMHQMNGLELIEACRRINPKQKAILASGTADETVCHNSPCKPDRFLAKPYQANQLVDLVRAVLAE